MIREDHEMIRAMHGVVLDDYFRWYMSLPFFTMTVFRSDDFNKWVDDTLTDATVGEIKNLLPFQAMAMHVDHERDRTADDAFFQTRVLEFLLGEDDERFSDTSVALHVNTYQPDYPVGAMTEWRLKLSDAQSLKCRVHAKDDAVAKKLENVFNGASQEYWESALIGVVSSAAHALDYFMTVEEQDLFPIEKRDKPKSKRDGPKSKKPWTRTDLPRVLFLNRMPSERGDSVETMERHIAGHRRRGHWRHLTAERFKKKMRIRVRPTWVGPKNVNYCGATYRLIEK